MEGGKEIAGIATSIVRRRRKTDSRRTLVLNLLYDDCVDETDVVDEGGDVTDEEVGDDTLVGVLGSLDESDVG